MRLQEKVKRERVRHARIDDRARRQVARAVHVLLVLRVEAVVVALGADNESNLRRQLVLPRPTAWQSELTLGRYLASISRAALSMALYSSLHCQLELVRLQRYGGGELT
jgi:hypothetical protein